MRLLPKKWLKEIKFKYYVHPVKPEWGEEDEINIGWLISYLKGDNAGEYYDEMMRESLADWLEHRFKSLKPQYHGDVTMTEAYKMGKVAGIAEGRLEREDMWKPTQEQMNCLLNAEGKMRELRFIAIASCLAELYNDLKKLMKDKQ